MTAAQLADLLKVGPHGYIHGWIFVGIPGGGGQIEHPELGRGRVTGVGGRKVRVRFDSGAEHSFEHRPGAGRGGNGAGHFVPRGLATDNPAPSVKPGRGSQQGDLLSAEAAAPAGQTGGRDWTAMRRQDFDESEPLSLFDVPGSRQSRRESQAQHAAAGVDLLGVMASDAAAKPPRRLGEDTRPAAERVADFHARGGAAMGRQGADPGKSAVNFIESRGATGGVRGRRQAVAGLSDAEARAADSYLTHVADTLGRHGEVSDTHQMIRDRLAGKPSARQSRAPKPDQSETIARMAAQAKDGGAVTSTLRALKPSLRDQFVAALTPRQLAAANLEFQRQARSGGRVPASSLRLIQAAMDRQGLDEELGRRR
jgi:hypothetical protein